MSLVMYILSYILRTASPCVPYELFTCKNIVYVDADPNGGKVFQFFPRVFLLEVHLLR